MLYHHSGARSFPAAFPWNLDEVRERLRRELANDFAFGTADAVLVRVRIDAMGTVRSARALGPTIAGFIRRRMPALYDADGRPYASIAWAAEPAILRAAERAARHLRFSDGAIATYRVAIRMRLTRDARDDDV